MDDKEYYSYKRITSLKIDDLVKASKKTKKLQESKYKEWEKFQGREDAQMMMEKKEEE